MSLDEAKGLELQARRCAERLELAGWSIWNRQRTGIIIVPGHTYNSTNAKVQSLKARACARMNRSHYSLVPRPFSYAHAREGKEGSGK